MSTPTPKDGLDLDTLEEDGAVRVPYAFKAGGQTWTAYDPDRLDWTVIAALDNDDVRDVLGVFLKPDEFTAFVQLDPPLPTWKVKRLVTMLNRHFYGAEKPAGESLALPTS